MLAIPVPFIVSMLFGLLAITLYFRFSHQAKMACLFLGLCALTTAMVGLRWTFQLSIFTIAQPILASMIPIVAWYTFAHVSRSHKRFPIKHYIVPFYVIISASTQFWLKLPLDEALTLIYVGYGIALIRISAKETPLLNVSLGNWEGVKKAENIAGWMLIFSALTDTCMSLDFAFNQGTWSLYILTIAHLILLPVLSIAVIIAGINIPEQEQDQTNENSFEDKEFNVPPIMTVERAKEITELLDSKIRQDSLYLDPELTLAKLTRKLGVPAKQISIAVNQTHGQNISRFINAYRVKHAKQALVTSRAPVTQIFMNSGFQTKSNFNREFSRVTGMTPTDYRKHNLKPDNH
ncbi:helix-turn-helix domain-containing protein [Vibrio salinus]|uniref:helix-turn-helix domain-containing protein n=1 Tax=Vibrio salinus TaxID=2899784 RepID=UPI001E63F7D2|nr:helix-turn-helix domain-containing protein [Vibrio salinus]MCE0495563.1 helix-turn-helix domain-containing protein [Vibrio salinus]